ADPLPLANRQRHVLEYAEAAEQRGDLECADKASLDPGGLRESGDIGAVEMDLPGARLQRARYQLDKGCLAGAVRPDQGVPRAALQENRRRWPQSARRSSCAIRASRAPACSSAEAVEEPEHAAASKDDDKNHQEPDPEIPIDRVDLGEAVLRDHVERHADERAVKPPDTPDDQHDQNGSGAFERQKAEADELCRLRDQAAGDTGQTSMPCSPSSPPVTNEALLAASATKVATTKVCISKASPVVRSTTRPDKNPRKAAATPPAKRPVIGSPQPCAARIPAVYAPVPKNAACPRVTIPA